MVDNKTMARLLAETADLMEIDGADSFRIRSYRRAAEAAEQTTVDLGALAGDTAQLLEIDGIGKGMAARLQSIAAYRHAAAARRTARQVRSGRAGVTEASRHGPQDGRARCGMPRRSEALNSLLTPSRQAGLKACRAWATSRLRSCARASRIIGDRRGASASMLQRKKRSGLRPICSSSRASKR